MLAQEGVLSLHYSRQATHQDTPFTGEIAVHLLFKGGGE